MSGTQRRAGHYSIGLRDGGSEWHFGTTIHRDCEMGCREWVIRAEPRAEGLREALEREPTLDEVLEYGLDGAANPDGYLFNTLQWRLDLVRAGLAETTP